MNNIINVNFNDDELSISNEKIEDCQKKISSILLECNLNDFEMIYCLHFAAHKVRKRDASWDDFIIEALHETLLNEK